MTRFGKSDAALDALNEERDHLSIQISLAAHAESPDPAGLAVLRDRMMMLERRISHHKPVEG